MINFFKKHKPRGDPLEIFSNKRKQRGDPLEIFYGPSLQIELDAPLHNVEQKNEEKNVKNGHFSILLAEIRVSPTRRHVNIIALID